MNTESSRSHAVFSLKLTQTLSTDASEVRNEIAMKMNKKNNDFVHQHFSRNRLYELFYLGRYPKCLIALESLLWAYRGDI